MTCSQWTVELVECARLSGSERQLTRELRAHLTACESCRERWDAEILLTSHLSAIRNRTRAFRSQESSGTALRQDFVRMHKTRRIRTWGLAAGVAAALILAVVLGYMAGQTRKRPVHEARQQAAFYD